MQNKLDGVFTILKEINIEDAELICTLRNNQKYNKFLSSQVTITIEKQKEWIKLNKLKNDNFYFKIIDKQTNKEIGTISLYNIKNEKAEFGRYICESPLQSIESEFLILKFGFEVLKMKKIYCNTFYQNKSVWRQHYNFGFRDDMKIEFIKDNEFKQQEMTYLDYKSFDFGKIHKIINFFTNK